MCEDAAISANLMPPLMDPLRKSASIVKPVRVVLFFAPLLVFEREREFAFSRKAAPILFCHGEHTRLVLVPATVAPFVSGTHKF
jgi:hypothetical protein